MKIYGADLSSPVNKVRFVANFLGLEYDYVKISVKDGEHRKEEYLKINPTGKIPALDDDGFSLFESGAIIRYLAAKQKSDIYPEDIKTRAVIDGWSDFSSIHIGGAMGRVLFNTVFYRFIHAKKDERSLKDGQNFLARFLPVADQQLSVFKYLAGGRITLADFTLLSVLDPAEVGGVDLSEYPQIVQWRNALKEQDFYVKCHKDYGLVLKKMTALNK